MELATAKTRAEELISNLQKRARGLIDSEAGVVTQLRELVEERGMSRQEVRDALEEAVGKLKANELWDQVSSSKTVVALSDYRGEVERRVEDSVKSVLGSLQIASSEDLEKVEKKVKSLTRKVNELSKQLKAIDAA
jgi:polyhydroxyalkanoate synthesis regulator phasin